MSEELSRVASVIRAGSRFLVMGHRRPDADALGSALGLAALLRLAGKEAAVYTPDELPDSVLFLVPEGGLLLSLDGQEPFDATFVMDTASPGLLPEPFPEPALGGTLIGIDHHRAFEPFGDLVYRDVEASATAVLVIRLAEALGVDPARDRAIAEPLYAALLADTGGFRYPGTTSDTLRLGAKLLDAGLDPWHTAYQLFEDWPLERMRLLGAVLETLELELDGRLAILCVTRAMLEQVGASPTMVEGLVNYARKLRGVEVAVLLWEWEPERDAQGVVQPMTKLSLRSAGRAHVSTIAVALGGGGHWAAAGANLQLGLDEVRAKVVSLAKKLLDT